MLWLISRAEGKHREDKSVTPLSTKLMSPAGHERERRATQRFQQPTNGNGGGRRLAIRSGRERQRGGEPGRLRYSAVVYVVGQQQERDRTERRESQQ